MGSTNQESGAEVAAVLPALVAKTGCDDWTTMRPPLHCRDCTIHFLKSPSFRFPGVVIKIFKDDIAGHKKARRLREIQLVTRHFNKASTPGFKVPRPVFMSKEHRALGMEFIDAPMSSALLKKAFFNTRAKEEIIRKSARWLQWFHSNAEPAMEPFRAERYQAKLAKTVDKIGAMNPDALSKDPALRESIRAAGEAAGAMDGIPMMHAVAHGDFTPFNLFIREEEVIGFDFQDNGRFPLSYDICRYLLYLDFTRILPAPAMELRKYGCRRRNFEVFMEGYGAGPDLLGAAHWPAFHFMEVVRRMTSLTVMQERGRNRPLRHIEMASLRRSAKYIMDALG